MIKSDLAISDRLVLSPVSLAGFGGASGQRDFCNNDLKWIELKTI